MLEQELNTLAAAARRYDARHRRIARIAWPEGMRIAVNFTADFDAMLLRRLMNEPPMQLAKGEFGGRVGIWRLIELVPRCFAWVVTSDRCLAPTGVSLQFGVQRRTPTPVSLFG